MRRVQTRRVVVTGLGAITPLGHSVAEFWTKLCAGCSGVGPITLFDASLFGTRIAAEVRDWTPPETVDGKRLDRFALFGLAAALEAWQDSCLSRCPLDPYEVGVLVGSSHGGEASLLEGAERVLAENRRKVGSHLIPRMLSNMAAAQIAMRLGLHGPSFSLASACATGGHAIGEAAEIIRRGDATVMLCGGTEATITPLTLAGDEAARALSRRNDAPERASRPFDLARDGFVLGEGAGILVLEAREHALARRARIKAELSGYAATADAVHETRPDPAGVAAARGIERALAKADLLAADLDAVFAHATGTTLGDPAEFRALALALGDTAACRIPVTAIKASLGHLLGAAGAVQAVAAVKALQTQTLPPTLNLEVPDSLCPVNAVTGAARQAPLARLLSNSFGFGGQNASLVFSSAE